LTAAGTKWNLLPLKPRLVGGHCIGVDPSYLEEKVQEEGDHRESILSGRIMKASRCRSVETKVIRSKMRKDLKVLDAKVLLLGCTFKENCPNIRNTRIIDIYNELRAFDIAVEVYDPWANAAEVKHEYGIDILPGDQAPDCSAYSAIILGVAHKEFESLNIQKSPSQVVYDVKGILKKEQVDARL